MTIRPARTEDTPIVRELFLEYAAWLQVDLCLQGFDEELATLPGSYTPPRGGMWLAVPDGDIAGVVAMRPHTSEIAELKRLWVRASHRGAGLGRILTATAIEAARTAGYNAIRLDTLHFMDSARALYEGLGFRPISPFYDNREVDVVFMELAL